MKVNAIYPSAPEVIKEDVIDETAVANKIIQLRENGAPADYSGFNEGDVLSKPHITSIAQNMGGTPKNAPKAVSAIFDAIEAERLEFAKVVPTAYDTEADYKSELAKKKKYLDETVWVDGMKDMVGAKDFAELKDMISSELDTIDVG